MKTLTIPFAALLLLAQACASASAQQAPAPKTSEASGPMAVYATSAGAPTSARELASRLRVRHPQALPTATDLKRYQDAELALIWIADRDQRMVVRVRALGLLQHFPTPRTRAALLIRAEADKIHASIRGAAMRSLEAHNRDPHVVAVLKQGTLHPDIRVSGAATRALASNPQAAVAKPGTGASAPKKSVADQR